MTRNHNRDSLVRITVSSRAGAGVTIAACYVNLEGIVLGADSTSSTYIAPSGFHYLNYNQKLFEIGEGSTLGIVTWGLGSIGALSHRTQIAILADNLKTGAVTNVLAVAQLFAAQVYKTYFAVHAGDLARCHALQVKPAFDKTTTPPDPNARTQEEETEFNNLWLGLSLGFCIGGYIFPDRTPSAAQIQFDPTVNSGTPTITPIMCGSRFWGAPKIFCRLIKGYDPGLKDAILKSGKWSASHNELDAIFADQELIHSILPIREAVDFIHVCIYSTIKALKFSPMPQICGGPIELATITTDRKFRWVRHKEWDSAILDGENR